MYGPLRLQSRMSGSRLAGWRLLRYLRNSSRSVLFEIKTKTHIFYFAVHIVFRYSLRTLILHLNYHGEKASEPRV